VVEGDTRTTHPSFCRICEAECGVIATVENGRIIDVKANKDNPHSEGFMCTKARAMVDVVYDPDRVLTPLKRVGAPGQFQPCGWDEALDDIAGRLKSVLARHRDSAFAMYMGNPAGGYNTTGAMGGAGLCDAIGSPPAYGIVGEDHGAFVAASAIQFGSPALWPRSDVWRTDFLLMAGANPWVSKGSLISEPQIRQAMSGIVERGGRVVVVDPRRTETARQFEHVPVRPGMDAWLFLGMLSVITQAGLVDRAFVDAHATGFDRLEGLLSRIDVELCAARTGIPAEVITNIGLGFGQARAAAAYGRTGTSTQRFGTLNMLLINTLNIVTGNLNAPGGAMFGWGAIDFPKLAKSGGLASYAESHSRGGLPKTLGQLPTQSLWRDFAEPGEGQIRAMCTFGGNPVLTSGAGGERLKNALEQLELHFSLDLYVNETNAHAHYILPAPTFFEREDLPWLAMVEEVRPTLYATGKLIEKRGDSRDEWRVFNDIARRMGLGGAYSMRPLRWLSRLGVEVNPMRLYDFAIRTGPVGDRFGLRRNGWSLKKLRKYPNGVRLADHLPVQNLRKVIATPDKRIRLAAPEFVSELSRLVDHREDDTFRLRAIGLREIRSHNSWMHNSPCLTPDTRHPTVLVHPSDARDAGVDTDGDEIVIESASGAITMQVTITTDMTPGTIAIPHGWGHQGGWRRANAAGGANSNILASADEADIERLAGMSILSGIPVRLRSAQP
jgi:anaerobic selenocysteine-containing dehydrogenase